MNRRSILVGIASITCALTASFARAADPPATTINVKGMQCAACASHVAESLQNISGVAKAEADAAKAIAVVTPRADVTPSPKALWEAVEKAGYTPVKLVTPSGTFTSKPKS